MSVDLKGIIDWLNGWFYRKEEVNTYLNAKANKNLTNANMNVVTDSSGNITTEAKPTIPDVSGKIDTAGTGLSKSGTTLNHSNSITAQSSTVFKKIKYDGQGHITGTANVESSDLPTHTHSIASVTNLQTELNGLDTRIDALESFEFIKVVSDKGTASASTMNTLYIVQETDATTSETNINVYYTKKDGSNYSWVKLDDNILDELDLDWSNIENNPFSNKQPSDFANATHNHAKSQITDFSHTHGNLSYDGKLTTAISSTNKVVVTDSQNKIGVVELDDLNCGTFSELQTLINNATNGNGVVVLDRDYKNSGSETEIVIPATGIAGLTIVGNGHKIDADKKSRIFNASNDNVSNVVFKDLVLINGYAHGSNVSDGYGGAIYSPRASANTISNCKFFDNNATYGGAIYCVNYNYIDNCYFQHSDIPNTLRGAFVYNASGSNLDIYNCSHPQAITSMYPVFVDVTNKPYLTSHQDVSGFVTSISLVPKSDDSTGAIRLYYGDEPNNS